MRNGDLISPSQSYEFGVFRLEDDELYCEGTALKLPPKVFQCLTLMVERAGKTIPKDEFFEKIWPDTFVEDNALSYTISQLRKALAEFDGDTRYIETVPRRGFRFIAGIRTTAPKPPAGIVLERRRVEEVWLEETIDTDPAHDQIALSNKRSRARRLIVATVLILAVAFTGWFMLRRPAGADVPTSTRASAAALHTSFANEGRVITDFGTKVEKARAVALQPDGKIVVAGWAGETEGTSDLAIARYRTDGSIDPTFGGSGKVVTAIGAFLDIVYAVAIQPDGKIVAAGVTFAGESTRSFCIARYKSDGALDAAFDGDGIVTLNIGTALKDTAYAIAIEPDGKIVVAGSAANVVVTDGARFPSNDYGLIRLNADGSLDTGFGSGGMVITNFGYGVDIVYALVLQPDGKILAGGMSTNGSNNDFAIARYTRDGALDETFGSGGKVRTDFFSGDDMITSMALRPDGRIVAAGGAVRSTISDFAVAMYTEDGSLDNSFNGSGKVTVDLNEGNDVAFGVRLLRDGKLVIAGQANVRSSPEFALARLNADGKLDETFGDAGKSRLAFEGPCEAWGFELSADGFAILVGNAGDSKLSDFAIARVPL